MPDSKSPVTSQPAQVDDVMAISEEAQGSHDALFPDHHWTLKVTDPEFIEIFDNWAFGDGRKAH